MQTDGDLFCICKTSPFVAEKRGGLTGCPKFCSYSSVLTELDLWKKRNEWRTWMFDGVEYFVALDGKGCLVVFELVPEKESEAKK